MRLRRDALLGVVAATVTAVAARVLGASGTADNQPAEVVAPSDRRGRWVAQWERTNHSGRSVTLLEGVALVAGAATTAAATARVWPTPAAGYLLATAGAGALGALDDLRQDTDRKGLAGHLRALAHGRVTTGAVKLLGISASALAAVTLDDLRTDRPTPWWSTLVGGAAVAGAANLANLFDLRPGRALKVAGLVGLPLVLTGPGSPAAAVTLGAGAAVLPADLAGRSMLGDTGANPLGAALGMALVARQGAGARCATLAVVTALTLASERVSFTRVIESTPVLRELDALGRGGTGPA